MYVSNAHRNNNGEIINVFFCNNIYIKISDIINTWIYTVHNLKIILRSEWLILRSKFVGLYVNKYAFKSKSL